MPSRFRRTDSGPHDGSSLGWAPGCSSRTESALDKTVSGGHLIRGGLVTRGDLALEKKVPVPERRCRDPCTMSPSTRSGLTRSTGLCISYGRKLHGVLTVGCILGWTLGGTAGAHDESGTTPAAAAAHSSKATASRTTDPRAPELSVASLGGGLQDAQQTALFAPFSKQSGVQVQLHRWDGALATLQAQAQTRGDKTGDGKANDKTGSGGWDLVLMEAAPLRVACREGLFLSRPLTADPADTAPDSSGQECGVHAWRMNLVLAWDKSRVDMTPSWADFWDVARRPGKRGLRRDPRGTLEIALMADGVAPDDVYRTLATTEGADRAFRKLDQLKPYIVWWDTPAEAVQIIDGGAVLMTSAPNDEVVTADQAGHRSFGTQWAQSLGIRIDWGVPRATTPERRALAQQLLTFLADPAHHPASPMAATGASTPLAVGEKPSQDATKDKPGSDGQPRATLMMDDGFWADHLVPLRQRLDNWIGLK